MTTETSITLYRRQGRKARSGPRFRHADHRRAATARRRGRLGRTQGAACRRLQNLGDRLACRTYADTFPRHAAAPNGPRRAGQSASRRRLEARSESRVGSESGHESGHADRRAGNDGTLPRQTDRIFENYYGTALRLEPEPETEAALKRRANELSGPASGSLQPPVSEAER